MNINCIGPLQNIRPIFFSTQILSCRDRMLIPDIMRKINLELANEVFNMLHTVSHLDSKRCKQCFFVLVPLNQNFKDFLSSLPSRSNLMKSHQNCCFYISSFGKLLSFCCTFLNQNDPECSSSNITQPKRALFQKLPLSDNHI